MYGKRLAARLREYDWMAALIELVIVVVGILIALQVSNWNQDRQDRAHGDRYNLRLQAELHDDRLAMDEALAFWRRVTVYGRAALDNGEHGMLVQGSRWKTVLAWYQASQLFPFELADTTFLEMRDTGDLGLITDESLRKRLADYYRMNGGGIRSNILRHDPVYRIEIRGLTPMHVQEYIWNTCFRQGQGVSQTLVDCPSPISEQEAADILDRYHRDDTLLLHLRTWMSTLHVSTIIVQGMRRDAVSLAKEIGNTPDGPDADNRKVAPPGALDGKGK